MSEQRVYGGASADARRDDRRQRLIDAAFEILAVEGTRGLTIRKVATAAGVSPRYIYEGFTDLEDLRGSAFDSAAEEIAASVLASIDAAAEDPRSRLTAVLDALSRFTQEQPHKARLLLTDSFGDPSLLERRLQMTQVFAAGFSFYVRELLAPQTAPEHAIGLAARVLVGATAEMFTGWLEGSLVYPAERLVPDTVELFLATINALSRVPESAG